MYCSNCGRPMSEKDKFCPNCGVEAAKTAQAVKKEKNNVQNPLPAAPAAQDRGQVSANQGGGKSVKAVKRVYYDKNGKPMKNPNTETRTETVMQGIMIACIAIALIIVTIAGSMFISGSLLNDTVSDKVLSSYVSSDTSENKVEIPPQNTSSEESSQQISSDEAVAAEVSSISDELLAVNIKNKIAGKWEAKLPYKSMSLPAVFTFDESGECTCTIKALFISQKFNGTYDVEDGGACSITLSGIGEYIEGNDTISGNARFISDDELEFTANGTVWSLIRAS